VVRHGVTLGQGEAPYLAALEAHAALEPGRYNVPTHKGGVHAPAALVRALGLQALRMDIPPLVHGIDDGVEPTPLARAQELAAAAWGAQRTWFLVNGASNANHAACLALGQRGDQVVVQRNVHSSTIDGLILAGLRPHLLAPELGVERGVAHCLTPEALDSALAACPAAAGAVVVSPTYYGMTADVPALVAVAHAHGVPILVDEAWGSHLAFHEELPVDAVRAGADLVISSTHKMLGSLTQSAMLHLGQVERLDEATVDRSVLLVESTSPSALLSASLDAARQRAATEGHRLLGAAMPALARVRECLCALPGVDVLDDRLVGSFGVAAVDPFRVAIDVRATGRTGHGLRARLRELGDVFVELASRDIVLAVFGMGETERDAERLLSTVERALADAVTGEPPAEIPAPPPWGPLAMAPRDAFFSASHAVDLLGAVGRVAAETLAVYPPGIPNVLPGERLTADIVGYLLHARDHGYVVRGASDRALRTARVVRES
jgi:arginine decarboxylase